MKTITKLIAICCFIFNFAALVQAQPLTFTRVFYNWGYNVRAYSMVMSFDHNYMLAGESGDTALILKMNAWGDIIWNKKIGGDSSGVFTSIIPTRDTCFVLAGSIFNVMNASNDILCVKINPAGDTLWAKEIDMGYDDCALSVQQTYDNGYILAGYASQNSTPNTMVTVVKLDSTGNLTWGRNFTGSIYNNKAFSVKQTPDSGYAVIGFRDSLSSWDTKAFLMKLTPNGNISWVKKHNLPGAYQSIGFDLAVTANGLICYLTSTDNSCSLIMKTDFSGNVLWCKQYPGYGGSIYNMLSSPKLHAVSDYNYVFSSWWSLQIIDSAGNAIWRKSWMVNSTIDAVESQDKGFMILADGPLFVTKTPSGWPGQIAIIKTDSLGNSPDCTMGSGTSSNSYLMNLTAVTFTPASAGIMYLLHPMITSASLQQRPGCADVVGGIKEDQPSGTTLTIFPNPTPGIFQIMLNSSDHAEIKNLAVYNTMGEMVYHSANPGILQSQIDLRAMPNGIYYIMAVSQDNILSQKLLICH